MSLADRVNAAVRRVPKWSLYPLGAIPILWIYWRGITGGLGADPAKKIEHQIGLWAVWILIAVLTVTPLRRWVGVNLIRLRRPLGHLAFFYVVAHLLTWLVLDIQLRWGEIWTDIVKRPYITIGMVAFLVLIPLMWTSGDKAVRRLGAARWQRLHKFTYLVAILGGAHFVMVRKGWQLEPVVYLAVIAALVGLRVFWGKLSIPGMARRG